MIVSKTDVSIRSTFFLSEPAQLTLFSSDIIHARRFAEEISENTEKLLISCFNEAFAIIGKNKKKHNDLSKQLIRCKTIYFI